MRAFLINFYDAKFGGGMVGYYDLILIFRVLSYLKSPIRYNRLILSSFNRGYGKTLPELIVYGLAVV